MATGEFEGVWVTSPDDPRLVVFWSGSVDIPEDQLLFVLSVARIQCETFAPVLALGEPVPDNYALAQIYQARDLVRAGVTDTNGEIGYDGMTVPTFPMSRVIKGALRPHRGRPYFGGRRSV
jgi:hypothetical protein